MKTSAPFKNIKISLILISFLSISMSGFADPFAEDCSSGSCVYIDAGGNYQACNEENLILYAVDPNDEGINLTGATFEWFIWVRATEENGWIEEWVSAIGGSANRFEVTDNDSYSYYCEVSTLDGAWATSQINVSYVSNNASIGSVPQDETVCPGDEVELFATGSGTGISTQWEVKSLGGDWQIVDGEVSNSYIFNAAMGDDGSLYRFRVSNLCASIVSPAAELAIHDAPEITSNISNATKCEGTSAAYTISSNGSELSYQWQKSINNGANWTDISNGGKYLASDNNLSISDLVTDMDQDLFKCKVTGICGFTTYSDSATLTVLQKPFLLRQPADLTKCTGEQAVLSARGGGTEPISYQWRKGGVSVSETSTDTSFIIPEITANHAGSYLVRLTNQCTSTPVPSDEASLTVKQAPAFTSQPDDLGFCEGTVLSAEFSIEITGNDLILSWQQSDDQGDNWRNLQDTAAYTGSASSTLKIQSPTTKHSDLQFRCLVSGVCGSPTSSNPATLVIKTGPSIITPPQNTTSCLNEELSLEVSAAGSEPLLFQWKANNQSITDWVPNPVYTIESANFSDAKNYHVIVKNECNQTGISSDAAELIVNAVPVLDLGNDIHLCPGDKVQLNAGAGYVKYEWSTEDSTQKVEVSSQQTLELQVWNESGCSGKDEINIILDPVLPMLNLGQDISFCSGEETVLNASDQYDNYIWSNESQEQSIAISGPGTYSVSASRNNSVCVVSDTIQIDFTEPFANDNICLVTTDLETGENLIVWEKTADKGTAAYHILRQTSILNKYEIIGTVPFDGLSIFRDTEADPEQQQWVYKITAVDTCGNTSDVAEAIFHKPLFLQYQSSIDGVNLKWEEYEVENSDVEFESYEIYRGSDSTSLSSLAILSADLNVFTDKDPNALKFKYFYRVAGIKKSPCFPSAAKKADIAPLDRSYSNMENNNLEPVVSVHPWRAVNPLDIYPNPMTEHASIRFNNPDHSEYTLVIRDFSGKLVKEIGSIRGEEIQLTREGMVKGYYILELSGNKLFRGKLVVL